MKSLETLLDTGNTIIMGFHPVSVINNYLKDLELNSNQTNNNFTQENTKIKNIVSIALRFVAIAYLTPYLIKATIAYNTVAATVKFINGVVNNTPQKNKPEVFHPVFFHFFMIMYDYAFLILFNSYLCTIAGCVTLAIRPLLLFKLNKYIFSFIPSEKNNNQSLLLWDFVREISVVLSNWTSNLTKDFHNPEMQNSSP